MNKYDKNELHAVMDDILDQDLVDQFCCRYKHFSSDMGSIHVITGDTSSPESRASADCW